MKKVAQKISDNIRHPRQEHELRKAKRRPPLTYSEFDRGITAQNEGRDSMEDDRHPRPEFMYHATSERNAPSIDKNGIQASYGGKEGGASHKLGDPKLIEDSKNVVHGTTSRRVAGGYAAYHDRLSPDGESMEKTMSFTVTETHIPKQTMI